MSNKLIIVVSFLLMISCQKPIASFPINSPIKPFNLVDSIPTIDIAQITANISIQVFDTNKKPLSLATVVCGNTNVTTDLLGYAILENVAVSHNNASIIVKKDGYFSCTRTFVGEQGKWHFLKVILDDYTLTTTINSEKGGVINMPSGATVNIPVNAMVLKGTNTVYKGLVSVYTHWLDPSSPNLMSEIQGELRGIDSSGVERAIQTFGMVNVELKGSNNENLQLGTNQQSTISFPISASLQGMAPTTIPLWYFSETNHRWVQQGQATKKGSFYIGTVQHFTCWNVDYPKPYKLVKCKMKILTPGHDGCFNREILIHESSDSWGGHGYTDEDGYLDCSVPQGTSLKLDILGCASKSFTVGPYLQDENIDSIVLSTNEGFTIKGSVFDCSGLPLKNGYVQFNINGSARVPIIGGNYKINFQPDICSSFDSIYFYSVDLNTKKISSINSIPANNGSDLALNLKVCNDLSSIESGLNTDLVAYYPFNGNANDSSLNGLNGIINQATLTSDRFGNANSAYSFNGTSSSIMVNHDPKLNPLPLSVSCWFNFDATQINSESALINKYSAASWDGWNLPLNQTNGGTIHPWYLLNRSNNVIGDYGNPSFNAINIGNSKWHNIVFTVDSFNGGSMFIDGILITNRPWVGVPAASTNSWPMYFGYYLGSNTFYKGLIDDIRIYKRVLTQEEIQYFAIH